MGFCVTQKIDNPDITVKYGIDHACGWFYQEIDINGNIIVDEDSLFSGLSKNKLLVLLEKTNAKTSCKEAVALDLDPSGR